MKKKYYFLSAVFVLILLSFFAAAIFSGCKDVNTEPNENDTISNETIPNDTIPNETIPNDTVALFLAGTKWELVSIYDMQGDSLTIYEPADFSYCSQFSPNGDDCYVITFDSDSIAKGRALINQVHLVLYKDNTGWGATTHAGESLWKAGYYCDAIGASFKYKLTSNTLTVITMESTIERYKTTFEKIN